MSWICLNQQLTMHQTDKENKEGIDAQEIKEEVTFTDQTTPNQQVCEKLSHTNAIY